MSEDGEAANVSSSTQKDDRAFTKWVFITKVVPSLPVEGTDEWEESDDITRAARKLVVRKVWNEVQDNPGGAVQKLLRERKTGLMLCKGTILVGPEKKTPAEAVYVTDDPELLMADYGTKRSERMRLDADRYAEHMAEMVERYPEMAERSRRKSRSRSARCRSVSRARWKQRPPLRRRRLPSGVLGAGPLRLRPSPCLGTHMTTDELHELVEALGPRASRTIYEAMADGPKDKLWIACRSARADRTPPRRQPDQGAAHTARASG